ncbi:extracellular solute-binding protein [Paenibacillus senegalensis]|uniref:extracellular solute-binding protein n=1 Tax=Paenibacillus senegalensis TaxID=1465766 RepID=UPI0002888462|nr:extracellular solute-binding protein [Paenibacillus senegalensis]
MAKPDRKTFQERSNLLLSHIRTKLSNGTYQIGDYLPSETALAEQFELSKNSVRAVMERLVEEGLIRKIPRVGTQVVSLAEQTVLRFGLYPSMESETKMPELLELFQQKHPEIRLEVITLPYANPEAIRQFIMHGIVDVMAMNHFDYLYFRQNQLFSLLESYPLKESTYPFLNELFAEEDGRSVVRPFIFSPVIMCYNLNHFREERVFEPDSSWSWQDLRSTLRKLCRPNQYPKRYGFFFRLASINRWPILLLQNGASFERGDGKLKLPDPSMLDPFHEMRELMHEDGLFPLVMSFSHHDVEKLFKQQKVSVILTTYYRLNELADADFPFDIAQLPRARGGQTLLLSTGLAVSAASSLKKEAERLADFMLSEEVQTLIRRHTLTLPAEKRIAEGVRTELEHTPKRFEIYREMIPNFATHDQLGLTTEEIEVFGTSLEQYFSKLADEEELLEIFNAQLKANQQ